jgi:hypothetical protein
MRFQIAFILLYIAYQTFHNIYEYNFKLVSFAFCDENPTFKGQKTEFYSWKNKHRHPLTKVGPYSQPSIHGMCIGEQVL